MLNTKRETKLEREKQLVTCEENAVKSISRFFWRNPAGQKGVGRHTERDEG